MKTQKEKSNVSGYWEYFERIGSFKYMCNICEKVISAPKNSTSNLARHYRQVHLKGAFNAAVAPKIRKSKKKKKKVYDDEDSDDGPLHERRKGSEVWKHYTRKEGGVEGEYTCLHCSAVIKGKNSTSGLLRHFRIFHKNISYDGEKEMSDDNNDVVDDLPLIQPIQQKTLSVPASPFTYTFSPQRTLPVPSSPFYTAASTQKSEFQNMDVREAKIGFFGAGNIAKAIGGGLIKSGTVAPVHVMVSAPSSRSFPEWTEWGATTTHDNNELVNACDIIFLCMKPYQFEEALATVTHEPRSSKLFVSTLSGTSISKLSRVIGESIPTFRLIRSMPNTPLLVSEGCTVIAPDNSATEEDISVVQTIFRAVGKCEIVAERLISPVIGVAGSSPAFVYVIIEAMADAGVKGGLPRDKAQTFAAQAVLGAAKMVLESGLHPAQLKDQVCSPGGTTIYGIQALEKAGLRSAVMDAVEAATARSEEMTAMYE